MSWAFIKKNTMQGLRNMIDQITIKCQCNTKMQIRSKSIFFFFHIFYFDCEDVKEEI